MSADCRIKAGSLSDVVSALGASVLVFALGSATIAFAAGSSTLVSAGLHATGFFRDCCSSKIVPSVTKTRLSVRARMSDLCVRRALFWRQMAALSDDREPM